MKFYTWCIFSLSALHPSLNIMFCWLERKLFDPFNGHLSSDKLHLHSVKSLKFPFFSLVANWRGSPLITSFLTGHVLSGKADQSHWFMLLISFHTLVLTLLLFNPFARPWKHFTNKPEDSFINILDPLCKSKAKHQFSYQQSIGSCWDPIMIGELDDRL